MPSSTSLIHTKQLFPGGEALCRVAPFPKSSDWEEPQHDWWKVENESSRYSVFLVLPVLIIFSQGASRTNGPAHLLYFRVTVGGFAGSSFFGYLQLQCFHSPKLGPWISMVIDSWGCVPLLPPGPVQVGGLLQKGKLWDAQALCVEKAEMTSRTWEAENNGNCCLFFKLWCLTWGLRFGCFRPSASTSEVLSRLKMLREMWASCVAPRYESYRSGASWGSSPQLLASFLPTTPISSLQPSHPQRFLFPHLFWSMAAQIALWNSLVEKVRLPLFFPSSLSLSLSHSLSFFWNPNRGCFCIYSRLFHWNSLKCAHANSWIHTAESAVILGQRERERQEDADAGTS